MLQSLCAGHCCHHVATSLNRSLIFCDDRLISGGVASRPPLTHACTHTLPPPLPHPSPSNLQHHNPSSLGWINIAGRYITCCYGDQLVGFFSWHLWKTGTCWCTGNSEDLVCVCALRFASMFMSEGRGEKGERGRRCCFSL